MSSILLQEDLQNLSQGKLKLGYSVESGFGQSLSLLNIPTENEVIENDFVRLTVLEGDGTILLTQFVPSSKFDLDSDGGVIFNVGNHLRSVGFDQGTYNVQYEFLRRLSGLQGNRTIDQNGEFYKGPITTSEDGNRYKTVQGSTGDVLDETTILGSVDAGLEINNINPLRDEVIISPNIDITNEKYLEETEILFNPTYTYYLRTESPLSQKIDDIDLITEQNFGSSGIGVKSGQIAHGDNSIEFGTASPTNVVTREQFDKSYVEGTTSVILRDMFVTTVEQVPKTEIVTKTEVEARPLIPPVGSQTGTISDLAQWIYDGTADSWLPNLGVLQRDASGVFIVNDLVVGMSLKQAIQQNHITPIIDMWEELQHLARDHDNSVEVEYHNMAQEWWVKNRDVLRNFKDINGLTMNWDDYGILASSAYTITSTQIGNYISDWGDLDGTVNDLAGYFYITDEYDLGDLQARQDTVTTFEEVKRYADYVGKISSVGYDGEFLNRIVLEETPKEYAERTGLFLYEEPTNDTLYVDKPMFFRTNKSTVSNLRTYLYFKDGYRSLIVNNKNGGNSGIFKLYQSLPERYDIGSTCQIVEEVIPNTSFGVELIPWIETPLPTTILLPPGSDDVSETVQSTTTEYKNWAE